MKNLLLQSMKESEKFKEIIGKIENNNTPINISGLVDVGKSQIVSAISDTIKKPLCIVTYNEIQAKKLVNDLRYFIDKVEYFGKREIASYDYISESKDLPYTRIDVLNKIYDKQVKVVVTTVEAIMQSTISKEVLYKNVISFNIGSLFECTGFKGKKNLNNLKQLLLLLGYERNDLVENRGQFSIRGGIVDIGLSEKTGVRIEFWGDEVDSIRYFNLSSQRTTEMTNEIKIFPASEYILEYQTDKLEKTQDIENSSNKIEENDEKESKFEDLLPEYSKIISIVTKKIEEKYLKNTENKIKLSDKSIQAVQSDIEAIQNGNYISKIDKYFNEFYSKKATFLDYLPKNCILCIDENPKILQRIDNIIIENNNLIKSLTEKERFVPEGILNVSDFSREDWNEIYRKLETIYLEENNSKTINRIEFNYRQINFFKSETEIIINDIKKWLQEIRKS